MNTTEKGIGKKTDVLAILGAALLTGILFSLIFLAAGRFPGQKHLFLDGDYYYEYLPMIRMFLRHLLGGEPLSYSFEQSLGASTAETYTGDCMSPFNLLLLCFGDLDAGACAVVMAKLMAAAAAFAFLLRRHLRTAPVLSAVFASAYALCGFSINFYYHVMFLDGLYVLPLLVWAIRRFVRSGRWVPVALLYAYTFAVQAYIGYIVGFFTAFIFLLCCVETCGKDRGAWVRKLGTYVFAVILAVLLSAFVTVPEAMGVYHYAPSDNSKFTGLDFHFWELPGIFFAGQYQGMYNIHPLAYAGLPVLFLVPAFFLDRTIEKRVKIYAAVILGTLAVCCLWGPAYLFLHGFDNPDGCAFRYSWFWPFCLLYIAAYEMEKGETAGRKKLWIVAAVVWVAVYGILCAIQSVRLEEVRQSLSVLLLECNAFFLAAYALIFCRMQKGARRGMVLAALLSLELVANGYFILTPDATTAQRMREYYEVWQSQAEDSLAQIGQMEEEDPGGFYRIHYHNAPMGNLPMLYGYHGLGGFASQGNEALRRTLMRLGYATSVKFVADYGSTPLMRMLLSQRYSVYAGNPKVGDIHELRVEKHDETLSLGYMVSPQLLAYSADSGNVFENLNRLASAMTGSEQCPYPPYAGSLEIETDGMQVTPVTGGMALSYKGDGESVGSAVFRVFPQEDEELLAFFSIGDSSFHDKDSPTLFSAKDIGIPDHVPYLFTSRILPVGEESGKDASCVVIYMYPTGYHEAVYEGQYFASVDREAHSAIYRELKDSGYDIDSFSETLIRGRVRAGEDRTLLFTSIPFDPGWQVLVDGQEAEVLPVLDGAFCAVALEPGEHEVVWSYDVPWFRTGLLLSAAGLTVLILAFFADKVYINKKKHDPLHE